LERIVIARINGPGANMSVTGHKRRAKIINSEGEQQAAQKLVEATQILAASPGAMQLRYLGTLHEMAGEKNATTIVFPFPIDLVQTISALKAKS
jgi:regulator of protease activity HflC (stomatin/prohibitin superfamily)